MGDGLQNRCRPARVGWVRFPPPSAMASLQGFQPTGLSSRTRSTQGFRRAAALFQQQKPNPASYGNSSRWPRPAVVLDDSTVFVNSMVDGFDRLGLQNLDAQEAIVMFSSAELVGVSADGRVVAGGPGLYAARGTYQGTSVPVIPGSGRFEVMFSFRSISGEASTGYVTQFAAEGYARPADGRGPARRPVCTIGISGEQVVLGVHDREKSVYGGCSSRSLGVAGRPVDPGLLAS
jgi:hypothetical protein